MTGQPLCWKRCWIITWVVVGISGCAGWTTRERAPLGPMVPLADRSRPVDPPSGGTPQENTSLRERSVGSGRELDSPPPAAGVHLPDNEGIAPDEMQPESPQLRGSENSPAATGNPYRFTPANSKSGTSLPMPGPLSEPGDRARAVIRGQAPANAWGQPFESATPGNGDYHRYPMAPSGTPVVEYQRDPLDVTQPFGTGVPRGASGMPPAGMGVPAYGPPEYLPVFPPSAPEGPALDPFNRPSVDIDILAEEARTGRFMFGAGVNSDLGVTGQIVIDERNYDPLRFPTSWEDVINGTAWRGNGQGFRFEAMPGTQVHRYLITHTIPYFYVPGIPEPFVLSTSGFFFNRRYFDWNEQRLGGRVALGYRISPDLSLTGSVRGENVKIYDPRVVGAVPQLDRVVGGSDLFSGRITLTHDTRDNAFLATQGHLFELAFEQTFGSFDYPRAELDYRQYFLMRERPDGSGRHTLAYSFRLGFSGSQTPIFENYFTGGYSTMRGFDFRGASPLGAANVVIGGQFRFLGSVEYFFPLTADDMIKAVVFCDFGTTEEHIEMDVDNYRVSPGVGLRINIPAMGPAPLALDLAIPVARAPGDEIQNFSFFFGFSR